MDTSEHLMDLRVSVLEQAKVWDGVAANLSAAYAGAYADQQTELNNIRKAIEDDQKRSQAIMSFGLGLVTGGLLGPLADKMANRIFSYTRPDTLQAAAALMTTDEMLTEWAKNAFKELVKVGDDKVRGLVVETATGASPDAGFTPSSMTPPEYSAQMALNITQRTVAMSDVARLFYDNLKWLPAENAQKLNAAMKQSPFFAPISRTLLGVDTKLLKKATTIMMWIAWGKVRDTEWWDDQVAKMSGGQSKQWAPLLKVLQGLGIPTQPFTYTIAQPQGHGMSTGVSYSYTTTIHMPKFIEWAKGSTAATVALTGLPIDENARKSLEMQLTLANTIWGR